MCKTEPSTTTSLMKTLSVFLACGSTFFPHFALAQFQEISRGSPSKESTPPNPENRDTATPPAQGGNEALLLGKHPEAEASASKDLLNPPTNGPLGTEAPADAGSTLKTSRSEIPAEKESPERPWSADLYLELRALRNDLNRPVVRNRQDIEEVEVGLGYKLDEDLNVRISGASSQFNGENSFYLKEAFVTYHPLPRWFSVNLGQKLMSIGLLNELEHAFSSNPSYYRKLWTAKKGIDLGVETELYPFTTPWVFIKGSIYSGQVVRPGDNRMDPAEQNPREISLRSRSEYHEAFVSRFDQHLAFLDPITAYGAGVQASTRDLLPMDFQLNFLGEVWDLNERQAQGPDENTLGYFVFPSIAWKGFRLGYRYSEARSVVGSAPGMIELPRVSGRLLRAELQVTEHFALMGERVFENSDEDLRDEFVVRAVVDWKL